MPNYIQMLGEQLGGQAAGGLLGAGMGLLMQGGQDRRQVRQSEILQNLQMEGQRSMMDYGYGKQLQMWKDTSYSAQVEQMKKAGINPGLLYGMSGGGGTTTGSGSTQGPTGQQGPHTGGEVVTMSKTMMELGLQRAQQRNIEADTELKKATTAKTSGVDTAETQSKIDLNKLNINFTRDSYEDRLDIIRGTFSKLQEEIDILYTNKIINDETREAQIQQVRTKAIGEILKNELVEAQTKNTKQSTEESIQRIEQSKSQIEKWAAEIAQSWENIDIHKFEAEIKAEFPGLFNVMGGAVNAIVQTIGNNKKPRTYKVNDNKERK